MYYYIRLNNYQVQYTHSLDVAKLVHQAQKQRNQIAVLLWETQLHQLFQQHQIVGMAVQIVFGYCGEKKIRDLLLPEFY